MHLLELIHNYPEANTSEVAKLLGLTKGNISTRTAKLCENGFLIKYKRDSNRKEVYYKLTQKGQELYNAHEEFHEKQNRPIYNEFSNMEESQKNLILNFLESYALYIENSYLKHR